MHPRKEQSAKEIYRIVDQYCEANLHSKYSSSSAIPLVLGISDTDAQKLIHKILIALPDCFFIWQNQSVLMRWSVLLRSNICFFKHKKTLTMSYFLAYLLTLSII